jgi:response regulator RpfG family c-di-GMP phosphodiesterase
MLRWTAYRFLAEVKKRFPLVPRILLTGYADKENAIKAINNVGLYQYIEKPWDKRRSSNGHAATAWKKQSC